MKSVLVIDNNTDNVKLITFIMKNNGYKTSIALDGKTGINLAKQEKPDFILLDTELPDMTGPDVLDEIRKSDIYNEIPVIAMIPSSSSLEIKKSLIKKGFTGCIERPIDSESVIEQIQFLTGNNH